MSPKKKNILQRWKESIKNSIIGGMRKIVQKEDPLVQMELRADELKESIWRQLKLLAELKAMTIVCRKSIEKLQTKLIYYNEKLKVDVDDEKELKKLAIKKEKLIQLIDIQMIALKNHELEVEKISTSIYQERAEKELIIEEVKSLKRKIDYTFIRFNANKTLRQINESGLVEKMSQIMKDIRDFNRKKEEFND